MKKFTSVRICLFSTLILLTLAGCNGESKSDRPPAAIETYLQALVAKDVNQMINRSCVAWETDARQEFKSFDAVELTLEDLNCQEVGQEEPFTLVSCSGKVIASYRAGEILEIDVADRNFKVLEEGGEWRMCGYQ